MVVIFFMSMALLRDLNFNECLILMKIKWRKLHMRNEREDRKNTARSFFLFLTHKPIKWTFEREQKRDGKLPKRYYDQ
jgi:hypothetical protein